MSAIETGMLLWADRYMPGNAIMDQARAVEASGVVDWAAIPDQMCNFIPPSLWNAANTPLANLIPDPDSMQDAAVMAALAHSAAPKLGLCYLSDSRRSPAELVLMMWTLAGLTEGRMRFFFAPGEIKNINPYGHLRKHGLTRLEDLLKIEQAFWKTDGPVDFVGHHTELKRAYLGGAKSHRPRLWTMGTGPKQTDLTLTYCEGISGVVPWSWYAPETARTGIDDMKRLLKDKGRDPAAFGFGAFCPVICHEAPAVIDRVLDNAIIRWIAGALGRVNPNHWREQGMQAATPEGWTYFLSLFPHGDTTAEFAREVIAKTTRRMAEAAFICGNPAEVAEQLRAYAAAGLTWLCPTDYTALVLEPADAAKSMGRMIDVCARLKA